MTATITYKNAYINDCDSTTSWDQIISIGLAAAGYVDCVAGDLGKQVSDDGVNIGVLQTYNNTTRVWDVVTTNQVAAASAMLVVAGVGAGTSDAGIVVAARSFTSDGDIFTLSATTADLTRIEYFYTQLDLTDFSQTTYPKLTIRYKTSAASAGLQVQVVVVFADNSTSIHTLGYSTTWKVATVTPTSGTSTTISKIQLSAIEDAVANPNGTYYIYLDWFFFHSGTFTFPHIGPGGIRPNYPMKRARLEIPGRDGDINQRLGMKSVTIRLSGRVLEGETWRGLSTYPEFDYFLQSILLDEWCYFTCDKPLIRCQVMYDNFGYGLEIEDDKAYMTWQLDFTIHKLNPYTSFPNFEYQWGL